MNDNLARLAKEHRDREIDRVIERTRATIIYAEQLTTEFEGAVACRQALLIREQLDDLYDDVNELARKVGR